MTKLTHEMIKALEADGEKLHSLTGEDHGPYFVTPEIVEAAEHALQEMQNEGADLYTPAGDVVCLDDWYTATKALIEAAREQLGQQAAYAEAFDANVNRLKACEHIADGDGDWETLRNICPSTAAVARLRDKLGQQAAAEAPVYANARKVGDLSGVAAVEFIRKTYPTSTDVED